MRSHVSKLIAATAVLAAVSASAAAGPASAQPQSGAARGVQAKSQVKVKSTTKRPRTLQQRMSVTRNWRLVGGRPDWYQTGHVVRVESNGNTPSGQAAACDQINADIETALVAFDDYYSHGDMPRATGMLEAVNEQLGNALEQGCDVDF